jgi:hypothetical protein
LTQRASVLVRVWGWTERASFRVRVRAVLYVGLRVELSSIMIIGWSYEVRGMVLYEINVSIQSLAMGSISPESVVCRGW